MSVILPMYNAGAYIQEAVQSILNQSFAYFELIVIDDNSMDNSIHLVESFVDPRIKVVRKNINTGYTNSLNLGISLAQGKYIARMDADDVSVNTRFKNQVEFLEAHKNVMVCGSWFDIIDQNRNIEQPTTHEEIKAAMLEYNPIGHPTVMMRRELFSAFNLKYDLQNEPAEDYHLWIEALAVGELTNIPEVLLHYRIHNQQESFVKKQKQESSSQKARQKTIGLLYEEKPVTDITITEWPLVKNTKDDIGFFKKFMQELDILSQINGRKEKFDKLLFAGYIKRRKVFAVKHFFKTAKGFKKLFLFLSPSTAYYSYFPHQTKLSIIKNHFVGQ